MSTPRLKREQPRHRIESVTRHQTNPRLWIARLDCGHIIHAAEPAPDVGAIRRCGVCEDDHRRVTDAEQDAREATP